MVIRILSWCLTLVLCVNLVRIGVAESNGNDYNQLYFENVVEEFSNFNESWYVVASNLNDLVVELKNVIPGLSESAGTFFLNFLFPIPLVMAVVQLVINLVVFILSTVNFVFVLIGLPPLTGAMEYVDFGDLSWVQ